MVSTRSRLYNIWKAHRKEGRFAYTNWTSFDEFFKDVSPAYVFPRELKPSNPKRPLGPDNFYWRAPGWRGRISRELAAEMLLSLRSQRQLAAIHSVSQSTIHRALKKARDGQEKT